MHGDDLACRFAGPAAAGRAVGVKGFDLVADPHRVGQRRGAGDDTNPDFVGFGVVSGVVGSQFGAMQRVDADQVEARFEHRQRRDRQALANDRQRQTRAGQGARAGIRHLAFADIAIDIANRDLQQAGGRRAASAADPHPIVAQVLHLYLAEIGHHVGLQVALRIVDFVQQLLLAGRGADPPAGRRHLADDDLAVFRDLADWKAEPGQPGDVLDAGVGEIAAGDLPGTFQQVADDGALA